jgi:hypothetical protein
VRAGAGAVATYSYQPGTDDVRKGAPWAEAAVALTPEGGRPSGELALHVEPSIDAITGQIDERVEATVTVRWEPARHWTTSALVSAAVIRPLDGWTSLRDDEVPTTRIGVAEVRGSRRLGAHASLSLAAWSRMQRTARPDLPEFQEWGGALELAFDVTGAVRRSGPTPAPAGR